MSHPLSLATRPLTCSKVTVELTEDPEVDSEEAATLAEGVEVDLVGSGPEKNSLT